MNEQQLAKYNIKANELSTFREYVSKLRAVRHAMIGTVGFYKPHITINVDITMRSNEIITKLNTLIDKLDAEIIELEARIQKFLKELQS